MTKSGQPPRMREELIAPCGMNCNVCAAYQALTHDLRDKGVRIPYCPGCRPRKKSCAFLKKKCDLIGKDRVKYCYECSTFPCDRLVTLDRRYRERYRMSEIENLERIRDEGMRAFLKSEEKKWACPRCGGIKSCHNGLCFDCDLRVLKDKKKVYRWDDGED